MRPSILIAILPLFTAFAAEASASAPSRPALAAAPVPAPPPGEETGAASDPNIDRGVLLPTAETQPAGTVTVSNYELFFFGATAGLTDRLQIGLFSTALAESLNFDNMTLGNLKLQVLRRERVRVSLMAGGVYVAPRDHDEDDPHRPPPGRGIEVGPRGGAFAGGAASLCLNVGCHALLSGSLHVGIDFEQEEKTPGFVGGVSLTLPLGRNLKLLAEYTRASEGSPLLSLAVRGHMRRFAFDAGFVNLISNDGDLLLPVLFLSASYRFGGS